MPPKKSTSKASAVKRRKTSKEATEATSPPPVTTTSVSSTVPPIPADLEATFSIHGPDLWDLFYEQGWRSHPAIENVLTEETISQWEVPPGLKLRATTLLRDLHGEWHQREAARVPPHRKEHCPNCHKPGLAPRVHKCSDGYLCEKCPTVESCSYERGHREEVKQKKEALRQQKKEQTKLNNERKKEEQKEHRLAWTKKLEIQTDPGPEWRNERMKEYAQYLADHDQLPPGEPAFTKQLLKCIQHTRNEADVLKARNTARKVLLKRLKHSKLSDEQKDAIVEVNLPKFEEASITRQQCQLNDTDWKELSEALKDRHSIRSANLALQHTNRDILAEQFRQYIEAERARLAALPPPPPPPMQLEGDTTSPKLHRTLSTAVFETDAGFSCRVEEL